MGKIVGITEFKAKCIALLNEMERSGEPLTITRRGKPSLTLTAKGEGRVGQQPPRASAFGMLRHPQYRFDDPLSPAVAPEEWDANNPDELYRAR
ncbi:type II toxin-antitoxin system Phd/YefM family antitoxin [Sphingomonas ginsenosidimutans]|jgi:antitoxin (DNA-binding transcriptional repressor) of toxin-antitoxin stability system|nr:type II toxin-antitoxin system Phd/YefM family antitoxin [Sphingomonas ginsenosidimutans]